MKKNSLRSVAVLSAMCAIFATGCSKGIDINNEQNDIIANYAARIVVRTTKVNYLYTPDIKDTQPGQADDGYDNEETQTDSQGNTIAVKKDYTLLSDYMKMKGIDITYKDSVIGDEYPNDGSALFVVEAEPGKKLVAVEYFLTNNTDADITYSVSQDTPVFRLKVDSSKSVMSFKTLLLNDFSNMKDFKLAAGETKTAVIVFQIDADDAEALSKIRVKYGNGGSSLPTEPR